MSFFSSGAFLLSNARIFCFLSNARRFRVKRLQSENPSALLFLANLPTPFYYFCTAVVSSSSIKLFSPICPPNQSLGIHSTAPFPPPVPFVFLLIVFDLPLRGSFFASVYFLDRFPVCQDVSLSLSLSLSLSFFFSLLPFLSSFFVCVCCCCDTSSQRF